MNDTTEDVPSDLRQLLGTMGTVFGTTILLTGFCLIAPAFSRVKGASSSTRLVQIRARHEAGEPLTEGERLLLEERASDAPTARP